MRSTIKLNAIKASYPYDELLQRYCDEVAKELESYAHIGSENDSLVSRLLGVYNSGGIERDFTKEGHFVPTINKEAAHRIKELEARVKAQDEAIKALGSDLDEAYDFVCQKDFLNQQELLAILERNDNLY